MTKSPANIARRRRKASEFVLPATGLVAMLVLIGAMLAVSFTDFELGLNVASSDPAQALADETN